MDELKLPSNKTFGYFFSIVMFITAWYLYDDSLNYWNISFLFLSLLLLLITAVNAKLLLPINKLWMQLGLFLGKIVSPIVMAFIFFGLFTPISIILKTLGRDELRLKLIDSDSHWRIRNNDMDSDSSFKNQF